MGAAIRAAEKAGGGDLPITKGSGLTPLPFALVSGQPQ